MRCILVHIEIELAGQTVVGVIEPTEAASATVVFHPRMQCFYDTLERTIGYGRSVNLTVGTSPDKSLTHPCFVQFVYIHVMLLRPHTCFVQFVNNLHREAPKGRSQASGAALLAHVQLPAGASRRAAALGGQAQGHPAPALGAPRGARARIVNQPGGRCARVASVCVTAVTRDLQHNNDYGITG